MGNRTYMCQMCGYLARYRDKGRGQDSPNKHCKIHMKPLSHEQSYVATHLKTEKRLKWYYKGGYVLQGKSKRKKWIPAITEDEILRAIKQREEYRPRKVQSQSDYREIAEKDFNMMCLPYRVCNRELYNFLKDKDVHHWINEFLFLLLPSLRYEFYSFIEGYDMKHQPHYYLRELLYARIGTIMFTWNSDDESDYDEPIDLEIKNKLMDLWIMKGFPEDQKFNCSLRYWHAIRKNFGQYSIDGSEYLVSLYSITKEAKKCGIKIKCQNCLPLHRVTNNDNYVNYKWLK